MGGHEDRAVGDAVGGRQTIIGGGGAGAGIAAAATGGGSPVVGGGAGPHQALQPGLGLTKELYCEPRTAVGPDQGRAELGGVKGEGGEGLSVKKGTVCVQQGYRAILVVVDQLLGVDHVVLHHAGDLAPEPHGEALPLI